MARKNIFSLFRQALAGEGIDYTKGSLRRAIFLLAIPMILEMMMESVFAVVDIFFVGHLGKEAAATVGLTESVLTIVYSLAIGTSMAATATVARRIGEKNPDAAAKAGAQAALLALLFTIVISLAGVMFAGRILKVMGASEQVLLHGVVYTRIVYGSSVVIMLLFLINGIFRGAGDASIAMRSLWIANICNIILCPTLIRGWGPFPELGLTGAAVATSIGRGTGVLYQLYRLFVAKKGIIKIKLHHLRPDWTQIKSLLSIAWTGTVQFLIASASWIFLASINARFGDEAIAGYTVAIRVLMFFLLPAWGLSNAAATLVGQNLGAGQPERAEQSVWRTAQYNAIFMMVITILFQLCSPYIVGFLNPQPEVIAYGTQALRIMASGYVFYGVGMVVINAFNGAGDTRTPTLINIFGFWLVQVPLAYSLAIGWNLGPRGVFLAVVLAETLIAIGGVILFRRGRWKLVKV